MRRSISLRVLVLVAVAVAVGGLAAVCVSGCGNAVGDNGGTDTCGNLVVDDGEQCDDGNTIDGDGCSTECLNESFCGNSLVEVDEECDDGNDRGGDGCSSLCQLEGDCGNGALNFGETCDGSNVSEQTCATQTGFADGVFACATDCLSYDTSGCYECGNDTVEGPEQCDGANFGDETCMSQTGLPYGTLLCEPDCLGYRTTMCHECGNGVLEGPETCDDGNSTDWDGCTDCAITEFQVNTYTLGYQFHPDVAIVEDGSFIAVWESSPYFPPGQDGDGSGIFGQRFDSAGHPVDEEFQVNTYVPGDQREPVVAAAADGAFVVVWSNWNIFNSEWDVFGQRFGPAAVPLGGEFLVNSFNTGPQSTPAIAMAPDGVFVVVWMSSGQDGSDLGVFGQRYGPAGTPLGVEFQVNTHPWNAQWCPEVAMADDGRFIVVWGSRDQDGSGWGVFAQRYDPTGDPTGVEFQVNTTAADDQNYPSVAMAPDGRFVVVWQSEDQGNDPHDGIYAQRFDSAGTPQGGELHLNEHLPSAQFRPSVAMAADGRFMATWSSFLQDGSDSGVYGRYFDGTGSPLVSELQVNVFTSYIQRDPQVAMTTDGRTVVVWNSYANASEAGTFAKRYDGSGNLIGLGPYP